MTGYIRELQEIANSIDRYHKGATIANVTGSNAGAVGGVLTFAGIIAAPFTAGGSLILTAVGASIGGAGVVTNLTASITEYVTRSKMQKGKLAKKLTSLSRNVRRTQYALETGKVKQLLYGTPLTLSKTTRAVSGVVGALFIVWGIYSITKDSIELSKGSKTEVAKKLRDDAQKIDDALNLYEDICQFLKRLLRETGTLDNEVQA
ncbi:apolipoprotein L3-like [Leucoraja erinacea]|uniref:apolipoprotein L3-like n=1 Tax=Leucoraja erinaceus TaxID=7782 RepID=UPI002457101F|nr:apolipoprotein L3-like [Leucoraja erinacea]